VARIIIGTQKAGPLITQVFQLSGEAGLLLSLGLDEEEPGLRLLPPVELLLQALREQEQPLLLSALLPLLLFASSSLRLLREGVSKQNFAKFCGLNKGLFTHCHT